MFNEAWIRLAILMLLLGAALGQSALLLLPSLLLTVVATAWAWQRAAFWRVRYDRFLNETRVFVGEQVRLTLRLSNQKWLPLAWVRVSERMPLLLAPLERSLAPSSIPTMGDLDLRASLHSYERAQWTFTIPCGRRGFFHLGPARLQTGDLFGLFSRELHLRDTQRLIVYPRVYPLSDWGLPPQEPYGDSISRGRMFEDPLRVRGLRDYTLDDPLRYVHWPATARRGALQVKLHEPTITFTWVILLNLATFANTWQGVEPDKAERAISLAASLADYGASRKLAVGLVANGAWPESDQRIRVPPGRGPDQLRLLLEALAAVSYFVTQPFEKLLASQATRLPWGATLIVVTAIVTPALQAELDRLAMAGRRMVLVSLDEAFHPERVSAYPVWLAHAFPDGAPRLANAPLPDPASQKAGAPEGVA